MTTVHRLFLFLTVTAAACSFSDSSKGISDSFESSSKLISSSSPEGEEHAYQSDVRDYTKTYVGSGPRHDLAAFRTDLGHVAERHGITDWESHTATYVGVGEGLGKSGASETELLAYKRTLGGNDPHKMEAIQQGYDSAR